MEAALARWRHPAATIAIAILLLAASAAVVASADRRDADASRVKPIVQPLITESAPRSHHRLPFGSLEVRPTAIVAAAPEQEITVTVEPDRATSLDRVLVRLYRPAEPASSAGGGSAARVGLASETLELEGPAPNELEFLDLNPPPGRYRLEILDPGGDPGARLIERVPVIVYAQHRLPHGYATEAAGGRQATGAEASTNGGAGRALPSPRVNHNVSDHPSAAEAETFVAVEPDNAARVIAGVNPDGTNPQAWVSNDSLRPGTTIERTLPSSSLRPTAEGGGAQNLNLCCDPALAADDRGNLWYSVLTTGSSSHVVINRMAGPSGTTFQAQNTMIPRATTQTQDKPMITIDSWASSSRRYTLYAVWVENQSPPAQNVVVSRCDASTASSCDNPDSWSAPVKITGSSATYTYPSVAAAPNGDVYVTWWNATADKIEIDRCQAADDCATAGAWNEDADIDTDLDPGSPLALPFFCPIIAAPGGRVGALTYVEVGPDGRVYVAWSELRNNGLGTTRCTATGTDRTFDSYVAAGTSANVFPTTNSGVRLSDDAATAFNDHFFASLAADPSVAGRVETSLYSTKHDSTGQETHQYYVASSNSGASWSAMEQISDNPSDYSGANSDNFDYGDYEGGDAAAGTYYPVWTDNSLNGIGELFALTLPGASSPAPPPPPPPPQPAQRSLTVGLAGSGSGSVTGPGISCPGDCTESYADGTSVTLSAGPGGGSGFAGWSGDCTGTGACQLTMNADRRTTATFNSAGPEDTTPPRTRIDKRPRKKATKRRPTFRFSSSEPGSSFECKLDRRSFKPCNSPKKVKVDLGRHAFRVRAEDAAGNRDPTPARFRWDVVKR